MKRLLALLGGASLVIAACATGQSISPNDPEYGRSGAPRAGAPGVQPGNSYNRIQSPDSPGSK